MVFHESRFRTVSKAITFRALIVATDAFIIHAITNSYQITLGVIILSNISSTIVYIFHERAWNRIHWGKIKKR
jgi:uncharacterized membrane protein